MAGWVNRSEQDVIEYLQTENQVYHELLGKKRARFTYDQRRRLAAKAKKLGRKALSKMDCIVTPDMIEILCLQNPLERCCVTLGVNH